MARASIPTEFKINLDDFFEEVTQAELEELAVSRKLITIKCSDGDMKGKIKKNAFPDIDGYKFITHTNKDEIAVISRIFPRDIDKNKKIEPPLKMYKAPRKNEFFFDGSSPVEYCQRQYDSCRYTEFDEILRQGNLPLQVATLLSKP